MTRTAITGVGLIEEVDNSKLIDISDLPNQVRAILREEELVLYATKRAITDASLSIEKNSSSVGIVLGVDEGINS